ncbi:MAG: uracil-DNA glycosylase [Deltaproteobacteria bacterium]|nr:uracil-DNA glycosylase [Deltaproteobacteria bacterium]
MTSGEDSRRPPSCLNCRHYYVTWEPRTPHGCRVLGFKSRQMPHVQVQRTSGEHCRLFVHKPRPR